MTITQIEALNLLDQPTFESVLLRVLDFSILDEAELKYTIVEDATGLLSLYDRLMVNSGITVPADLESQMDAEFLVYQAELVVIENARLVQLELDRISDLVSRIDAIGDFRMIMNRVDSSISNPALYRNSIINADSVSAEALIAALEAEEVVYDSEMAAVQYVSDRQSAYESIESQMDDLYWDGVNGTSIWADKIAAVKLLYPKP